MNHYILKNDMASVAKTLGVFSAKDGECIERWTACAAKTDMLFNLCERESVGAVFLALRGEAREWAMNFFRKGSKYWMGNFKNKLIFVLLHKKKPPKLFLDFSHHQLRKIIRHSLV